MKSATWNLSLGIPCETLPSELYLQNVFLYKLTKINKWLQSESLTWIISISHLTLAGDSLNKI